MSQVEEGSGPPGRTAVAGDLRRVVLADALSPEGVEVLASAEGIELADLAGAPRSELAEALSDAVGLIVRSPTSVDDDLLARAPRLRVIGRAGVGVDNIDMEAATRRGIAVLNAPAGNTVSTAEHAFGLILAVTRRIAEADRSVRAGRWDRKALRGVQLHGQRLGVVGAGRIGSTVASRARAFGMEVVAYDPYLTVERAEDLGVELAELDDLLESSDVVTLHAPLTDETRGLIGSDELSLMKEEAYLVNAARGGLVQEEALARALSEGQIAGAALDVFQEEPLPAAHPLREAPGLVMTPHLGAATEEARREVSIEIARTVRDALLADDLRPALNAPQVAPGQGEEVEPVLDLARRSGLLLAELVEGRCRELNVRYAGPLDDVLRPLAAASAEGFLRRSVDRPLNLVNALYLAGERGIEVSRTRTGKVADYANYMEITAVSESGGRSVVGGALLGEGHPRLVRIDEFHVDTVPRDVLLVVRNHDVPGVIGEVGTRLGEAGINIAEYHQARKDAGGDALAVVAVDAQVPDEVLDEIRSLSTVRGIRQVNFGPEG